MMLVCQKKIAPFLSTVPRYSAKMKYQLKLVLSVLAVSSNAAPVNLPAAPQTTSPASTPSDAQRPKGNGFFAKLDEKINTIVQGHELYLLALSDAAFLLTVKKHRTGEEYTTLELQTCKLDIFRRLIVCTLLNYAKRGADNKILGSEKELIEKSDKLVKALGMMIIKTKNVKEGDAVADVTKEEVRAILKEIAKIFDFMTDTVTTNEAERAKNLKDGLPKSALMLIDSLVDVLVPKINGKDVAFSDVIITMHEVFGKLIFEKFDEVDDLEI
jgi:hypothetical protein